VLCAIGLLARLLSCLVQRGLQLANSASTVCLPLLVLPFERFEASLQVTDHLAPGLCESERLLPGGGKIRPPAEVQIEKEAGQGGEGRQCSDDGCDDGGHPAQARDSDFEGSDPLEVR
jgi:hypothetical protein